MSQSASVIALHSDRALAGLLQMNGPVSIMFELQSSSKNKSNY